MKYKVILFSITFFIFSIFDKQANAQNDFQSLSKNDYNKLLIGLNFSPDYCSQHNSFESNYEIPKFGFTAGINLARYFSKKFGIEGGIQFSNKGFATKEIGLYYSDFWNHAPEGVWFCGVGAPVSAHYNYNFYYIDVPIRAIILFGNGKTQFLLSGGFTSSLGFYSTLTEFGTYEDGNVEKLTYGLGHSYSWFIISPTISSGIRYEFNKLFSLQVEPTLRYGLYNVENKDGYHFWSAGLNVGFYYALK